MMAVGTDREDSAMRPAGDDEPTASRVGQGRWRVFAGRHVLTLLLTLYCLGFWASISDLPPVAANYPRILMLLLGGLFLVGMARDVLSLSRGGELPSDGTGDDPDLPQRYAAGHGGVARDWWSAWGKAIVMTVLIVGFLYLSPKVGFYAAMVLFLLSTFVVLGIRGLPRLMLLVIASSALAYLLFDRLLGLRLPQGIWMGG